MQRCIIIHMLYIRVHAHNTHTFLHRSFVACSASKYTFYISVTSQLTTSNFTPSSPSFLLNPPFLLSYLELHPAFLHSHSFPQPEGLCSGHPPSPSPPLFPGIPELPSMFLWQWEIQRLISLCQLCLSLCQLMKIWLASGCQECPES